MGYRQPVGAADEKRNVPGRAGRDASFVHRLDVDASP
jgi:hypothetical protein